MLEMTCELTEGSLPVSRAITHHVVLAIQTNVPFHYTDSISRIKRFSRLQGVLRQKLSFKCHPKSVNPFLRYWCARKSSIVVVTNTPGIGPKHINITIDFPRKKKKFEI
jgi:hypothetical protein